MSKKAERDPFERFFAKKSIEDEPKAVEQKEKPVSYGRLRRDLDNAKDYIKAFKEDIASKDKQISALKTAYNGEISLIRENALNETKKLRHDIEIRDNQLKDSENKIQSFNQSLSQLREQSDSKVKIMDQESRGLRADYQSLNTKYEKDTGLLKQNIAVLEKKLADRPTIIQYQDKIIEKKVEVRVSSWTSFRKDVRNSWNNLKWYHARTLYFCFIGLPILILSSLLVYYLHNVLIDGLIRLFSDLTRLR